MFIQSGIVVHPLSILISEDIFAYNGLYFIVYHCFDFRYGSFVRFVDLIASIVSFVSGQVSEFCIIYFQNTCVSMKDNRLVQTATYVVTADFTVISGFRYLLFLCTFCLGKVHLYQIIFNLVAINHHVRFLFSKIQYMTVQCSCGGNLELNLTIFRRPTHGRFTKISGHRHKSPPLPAPSPPLPGFILIGALVVFLLLSVLLLLLLLLLLLSDLITEAQTQAQLHLLIRDWE